MPDTDVVARFRLAFLYGEAGSQTIKQWGIYAVVLELPGQKLKVYIGSGTNLEGHGLPSDHPNRKKVFASMGDMYKFTTFDNADKKEKRHA